MENSLLRSIRIGFQQERSHSHLSRWLFLRLLGLVYLAAFLSLWTQIDGLIGSRGILPVGEYLEAVSGRVGPERFWWLPTFSWIDAGDGFLHFQCGAGTILSLLLIAGVAPVPALFLLWAIYLSLSTVCREFLGFQWDILLLETGFLAIFLAPRRWRPGSARETAPSATVLWLCRWLLFRLMFLSGAVKLLSGDEAWRNLTALSYHYETQPLPTWIGWYAHQMPGWIHSGCTVVMFGIELLAPFLIFCGRRARWIACGSFALLMLLISLTGNYCFFNLLTLTLCVLLLDDALLIRWLPASLAALVRRRLLPRIEPGAGELPGGGHGSAGLNVAPDSWERVRIAGLALLAAVYLLVSGAETAARLFRVRDLPWPVAGLLRLISPLRTINSYGLFAVMTTRRPEIVIEGSDDGGTWLAYEFKWKPGDLTRRPAFVAPHQPRLDWQMWFAALGDCRGNPWLVNFLGRLLEGAPEALALLEKNPFPGRPPSRIRAVLYEYSFTDLATRRATGEWWRRERKGLYCPELSLRQNNRH
jgi:hypothetical protein